MQLQNKYSKYSFRQIFTNEQVESLVSYIIKCSKMHYGLTMKQTRRHAFEYAQKLELKYPAAWDENGCAGVDWMISFRRRHLTISLRTPENTSAARSFGFSSTAVNEFFDLLQSILNRYQFPPSRIFNIDETVEFLLF